MSDQASERGDGRLSPARLTADRSGVRTGMTALGGLFGALLASTCCLGPLVLLSLGISGAWISNLTALAPYQPYFVALTLIFLAGGFYLVYGKPKADCAEGSYCATKASDRIVKAALWAATALIAVALAFPLAAPLLFDM